MGGGGRGKVPVGCTETYSIFLGKTVKQSRGTKGNRKSSIHFPNAIIFFFFKPLFASKKKSSFWLDFPDRL